MGKEKEQNRGFREEKPKGGAGVEEEGRKLSPGGEPLEDGETIREISRGREMMWLYRKTLSSTKQKKKKRISHLLQFTLLIWGIWAT